MAALLHVVRLTKRGGVSAVILGSCVFAFRRSIGKDVPSSTSGECGQAGDIPADDQGLDAVGALVGVHDLHVGHVPGDVVLQQ
jgi:hypothetical protein